MPHHESLPTPSNPSAAGITFYGSTIIAAPASLIWSTLLDFPNYSWNTFTPRVDFPAQPPSVGDTGSLDVYLSASDKQSRSTTVEVTLVDEKNYRLAWKGMDYPTWALRPERVQEIVDLGDGKYEYRTWETMQGAGVFVVKWIVSGKLDEANRRCGEDLKNVVVGKMGGK